MKNKLLRIRTVLMLAFAVLISGLAGSVDVAASFDNSVREGVVAVVVYMEDITYYARVNNEFIPYKQYEWSMSRGSGFFVGEAGGDPQYIVTNYHVIADYLDAGEGASVGTILPTGGDVYSEDGKTYDQYMAVTGVCELRVYYSKDDYDIAYVDCYEDDDKADLAVIRLRNPTDKRHTLKIEAPTDDMVGDTIYTVGFPGNADNDFTGASQFDVEDVTVHKGSVNKFVVNEGVGIERIAIDAIIQHGNSGGPLVTEEGNVIGVNTNGVFSSDGYEQYYYAISANELIRFLGKNNISYELAETAVQEDSSESSREESVSSESSSSEESSSNGSVSEESGNSSSESGISIVTIIIIVSAVFVVIAAAAVVIVLLVLRSKKKNNSVNNINNGNNSNSAAAVPNGAAGIPGNGAMAAPNNGTAGIPDNAAMADPNNSAVWVSNGGAAGIASGAADSDVGKAVIRSLSSQHNGRAFPVSGTPVTIGRDAAGCGIVYANGTPGVSGIHCQVSYDPETGIFTLTDLGSTYGTFLINGTKLGVKVPARLKSGDSFYVGDRANVLRVEVEK